jgi:S1-C subfamily serine protease
MWTVALLAGAIGSLLTAGLIAAGGGFRNRTEVVHAVERERVAPTIRPAAAGGTSVVDIAERLRPAIVQIDVDGNDAEGSGSGVLFRSDGHLLTNHHVVTGVSAITVVMADGKEHRGRLIGGDPETDIAVVKIEGTGFPVAPLGSAAGLKVGHDAVAIGSPLGLAGGASVTRGIVSALGREVESGDRALLDMIQTDAPIAPGSSGGALVDNAGSVIGITTAIAVSEVGAEGLGFATPIDIARDVANQLIAHGKVVHVWMGVEGEDLDSQRARQLGIDAGAVVQRVRDGSPAQKAGLREGDVITAVEGKQVMSMSALKLALRSRKPGDTVSISVKRDGRDTTVPVVLAEKPASP